MGKKLLTINELAEQMGVAVQTIYRWRSDGTDMPKGFKVGNLVRWREETVDAWIAAREGKVAA